MGYGRRLKVILQKSAPEKLPYADQGEWTPIGVGGIYGIFLLLLLCVTTVTKTPARRGCRKISNFAWGPNSHD